MRNAENIMPAIPVTMNWRIILSQQQNLRRLIPFYVETAAENLHIRNIKKAAALTAMQDLTPNAVYMRIFIFVVQVHRKYKIKKEETSENQVITDFGSLSLVYA